MPEADIDNGQSPDRLGEIYQAMTPRMEQHKRGYLRIRFGAALAVPLLVAGGLAVAAQTDGPATQLASGGLVEADPVPGVVIDDGSAPEASPEASTPSEKPKEDVPPAADPEKTGTAHGDETGSAEAEEQPIEVEAPQESEAVETVSLGLAGTAEVTVENEKDLTLGELDLNEGWEAVEIEGKSRYVVLYLSNGDTELIVTMKMKVKAGEMKVTFEDLDALEEEAKPKPEPEAPKPTPEAEVPTVQDGTGYSSAGGSVWVSRSGNTVFISITGTNGGWTSEMLYPSGDYAKVRFVNAERTTFIYVMGQVKDGKLVVGEWTETIDHHADKGDQKQDKDKQDKKSKQNKKGKKKGA